MRLADSDVVLGVDVGSSSCKTVAVDRSGMVAAQSTVAYPTTRPRPGWAEQDAGDWYRSAVESIRDCVGQLNSRSVAGLSLDGPAHNVAILDSAGEVLAPVIHWSDLRSVPQSRRLEEEVGDEVFEISLQVVGPGWTLPQLAWVREEWPEVWSAARWFAVTKDFVRYRLTGEMATDPYDAVGTQLYDTLGSCWSDLLCGLVGWDPVSMPLVLEPTSQAGSITDGASAEAGLNPGTPVFTGSGDTVTEAFGVGARSPGDTVVKLGTSGVVLAISDTPLPDRRLLTYNHVIPGRWVGLSATNSGAATLRWFHDVFMEHPGANSDLVRFASLAEDAPPGSDGLIFHPYLAGERSPYWDPSLRGAFSGVSGSHRLPHFVRAVIEGVAFSLRDGAGALEDRGYAAETVKLIGGGARSDLWCQAIADVLARPVTRIDVPAPSYGTALLAGIGLGWFDWDSLPHLPQEVETVFHPREEHALMYRTAFDKYQELVPSLRSGE